MINNFATFEMLKARKKCADFENVRMVLQRKIPKKPTLFEFFMNEALYKLAADDKYVNREKDKHYLPLLMMSAFYNLGYDYVTLQGSDFTFPRGNVQDGQTRSMNHAPTIVDWESFEKYQWPNPENSDFSRLEEVGRQLPDNMKIIVYLPNGVLENVIELTGYDNLCYMLADEPELVHAICEKVSEQLIKCHEINMQHEHVQAAFINDDWGYKTQTMLSVEQMREYIFPWHKKLVDTVHKAGRQAVLHSCGNLDRVMDDVIDTLAYDGKHSYEDTILPVEQAYDKYSGRIAVLGGMDLDYVCRSTPEQVYERSTKMLERAAKGGYGLGTGNSVPDFVPNENYLAMVSACL